MDPTIFDNFPTLETTRLNLRQLSQQDTDMVFEFNSDPLTLKYVAREPYTKPKQAENKVNDFMNAFQEKTGIWWTFTLKDTNANIGYGGIFSINQTDQNAEIGYGLLESFWGQGYISEVVKELVAFAFHQVCLHRLYAIVLPGNEASVKVLENNGFKLEGTLKDNAFARHRYFDNLVFGLINND